MHAITRRNRGAKDRGTDLATPRSPMAHRRAPERSSPRVGMPRLARARGGTQDATGPLMRAGEFCMREVVTAEREESVVDAARRMAEFDVGDLIVVDGSTSPAVPVGIITDRDLVIRVLATERAPHQVTIGEVMQPDLVTAAEDEELETVLARMRSHAIRRIPVLDRDGRLQGILSLDDVWGWIAEQALSAATLLQRQGPAAHPRSDRVQRS